jgi:hypothetical protein
VLLNGGTTYRGDVTFDGYARQIGDASVAENSVIDAELLDMDGITGNTVWDINAQLTIHADQIDTANNVFNGTIDVAGALINRITINLPDDAPWTMAGTLNLSGNILFFVERLGGSPVRITGDVTTSGNLMITSDATFADTSSVDFASSTTTLRMIGRSRVELGATFTGDGTLENGIGGSMSLAAGLSTGQVGVGNSGRLRLGGTVGVVSVDHFENAAGATLFVDVGRNTIGTDSDVLTTSAGAATLAGLLQPNIVNIGGAFEAPEIGDSFTVLTAVGGVSGTFDEVLDSLLGGRVYEWNAIYNPASVIIEIAAIAGLPGDYNNNGIVDAPDYSIWLDTLGSMTDLRADGSFNGVIDQADFDFWAANFGDTAGSGSENAAVPEPRSPIMLLAFAITYWKCRRRVAASEVMLR